MSDPNLIPAEVTCTAVMLGQAELRWLDPCSVSIGDFPIKSPQFLWACCAGLALIFSYQVFKLMRESVPITRTLRRITKDIIAIEPKNKPIDGIGLDQVNQVLSSSSLLAEAWEEFRETLIVSSDDQAGEIYNTEQAERYFSEQSIIAGRVNTRFYSALPSILTSLGLLATFIAILIGLSHIHPDPTAQGKLVGVNELVFSLSGKFISSICALSLAVVFTFLEKRQSKSMHVAMHKFVLILNGRLNRRSAEQILQTISRHIAEQSIAFRQFGGDLSGRLKESFSEGMGPHFQKVAEAVDELKKQKSESIVDSLGQVISEFKTALMGSTNTEFKTLEETLTRTANLIESMNEQSRQSQEKMSEVIQSLDASANKQSSSGQEQIARLANTMEIVIEKLHQSTTESSGSISVSVGNLLEKLEQSSLSQMSDINRRNEELASVMKGMLEQVQASLRTSSSSVEDTVNSVIQRSSEWSDKTNENLNILLEEQRNNARGIQDARGALNDALSVFRSAVSDGSQTLEGIGSTSKSVKDGVATLNLAVTNLAKSQDKVGDLISLVQRNAQNLQGVIDRQSEIVSKYENVVRELDRTMGNVLSQVTSSIENYSSRVKTSLETTLGQFDDHLGNATAKLGGTVQDLSESLEDLVEYAGRSRESRS